ncbi:centrin, EF-hand protein [Coemansia aciculifera]|nr:centrin, EF-hand protein [Coemansia aciculifera]
MNGEKYNTRSTGYQRPPLASSAASNFSSYTNHNNHQQPTSAAAARSKPTPRISRASVAGAPSARTMSQQNNQLATASSAGGGGIGNMTYEQREQLREVFDAIDRAGRGFVPTSKLADIIKLLGLAKPSRDTLEGWISNIDPSGTGKVDYNRLENFISLRYDEADQKQEIMNAFKLFKPDAKEIEVARITLADLQRISSHLGEHIPDEELREMINIADIGETGGVDFSDFSRVMRKTGLF